MPTVRRVHYVTDRAAVDRGREEKEMLEEEHKRQKIAHAKYAEIWDQLANEAVDNGSRAYAYRRKVFYERMLEMATVRWLAAKAKAERIVREAVESMTEVQLLERFEKTQRSEHYERRLDAAAKEAEAYEKEQRMVLEANASAA